jgi:hypothetical protein
MFGRKKLKNEIVRLQADINSYKNKQQKWYKTVAENQQLRANNVKSTDKINKLQKQIREQTEADLFFVSMKICFELLNGKEKSDEKVAGLLEQQKSLQQQLAAQQSTSSLYSYSYSPLSAMLGRLSF